MTYPLLSCACILDATKSPNANSTAEPTTQSNVRLPKEKTQTGHRTGRNCPLIMVQLFW